MNVIKNEEEEGEREKADWVESSSLVGVFYSHKARCHLKSKFHGLFAWRNQNASHGKHNQHRIKTLERSKRRLTRARVTLESVLSVLESAMNS